MPKFLILFIVFVPFYTSACTTGAGTSNLYASVALPKPPAAPEKNAPKSTGAESTDTSATAQNTDSNNEENTQSANESTGTSTDDAPSVTIGSGVFTSSSGKYDGQSTHERLPDGSTRIVIDGVEYTHEARSSISLDRKLRRYPDSGIGNSYVRVIPAVLGNELNNVYLASIDDMGIFVHGVKTAEDSLPSEAVKYSGKAFIEAVPSSGKQSPNYLGNVFKPAEQREFSVTADFGPSKILNGTIVKIDKKTGAQTSLPLFLNGRISGNNFEARIPIFGKTGVLYATGSFYGPQAEGIAGTITGAEVVSGKITNILGGFAGKKK